MREAQPRFIEQLAPERIDALEKANARLRESLADRDGRIRALEGTIDRVSARLTRHAESPAIVRDLAETLASIL